MTTDNIMSDTTKDAVPSSLYVWFADNDGAERPGERFIRAWTYDVSKVDSLRNAIGREPAQFRATAQVQAEAVREWHPIQTAPKDGTMIIISCIADGIVFDVCNGKFEVLAEDEDDGPWDIRDGEPWCSYVGREAGIYFCCWLPGKEWERGWKVTEEFEYTHWMALPAPMPADRTPSTGDQS